MSDDNQPTGLVALPPELVASVLDFVDPPSLVDFACTCNFLAQCSRDILKQHQLAHQYRVCTDILPTTLPALLRKVRVDPICAWHVRDLESCYGRKHWAHWKEFKFQYEESSNRRGRPPPPDYAFTKDERVELLDLLRKHFHFTEQDVDGAREDLEKGNDAPLKLLVFAFCPRVRSLKFSRHLDSSSRDAFEPQGIALPRRPPRSSLDYIQRAINLHLQQSEQAWPVGFSSLSDIGVGVGTGTMEIDDPELSFSPHVFADLMHLPNLQSIYFYGLRHDIDEMIADDQDGTVAPYNIDERSSSLQHILLDNVNGLSWKYRNAMIAGCRELKSLTITDSEMDDIDAIVQSAAHYHGDSMETLMFYETRLLHGYRCNMFRPESINGFNNLRTVYIDASDVMLDAMYNHEGDAHDGLNHEWIGDREFFIEFFMNSAFPESMEVLVLGSMGRGRMPDGDVEFFDQAIETMIQTMREPEADSDEDSADGKSEGSQDSESSTKTFDRRFPNLKAIYLGALDELGTDGEGGVRVPAPRKKRWFSRAIAAGRKAGVDVHTRTTRGQPIHDIQFPTTPNFADLKSAPDPPQEPWVFDFYNGCWKPRSCGNCGDCEECFRQYDRRVWKEVKDEYLRIDFGVRRSASVTSNDVREQVMLGIEAIRASGDDSEEA
ncbi:hypothetical protein M409DRAFT_19219 [Zasmidium cellare ATCC 36951]|uniref:F-box domain-containing protein n=1 Tax=Zasmidium cellare ATCC 36951 TaxID=1080233 RepID=A0A6A6CT16_ZASCE|nr:uncharacterized protein M409DRAFT_19219 [Zasmidium cellare ATCC 36951]KAF2170397.1 hypothetical protein M409DRAFT_19219 [Zasmidium cellare ATCC 36951]